MLHTLVDWLVVVASRKHAGDSGSSGLSNPAGTRCPVLSLANVVLGVVI